MEKDKEILKNMRVERIVRYIRIRSDSPMKGNEFRLIQYIKTAQDMAKLRRVSKVYLEE